jgi:hypothetical protein
MNIEYRHSASKTNSFIDSPPYWIINNLYDFSSEANARMKMGSTAEAAGDTALVTELTTEYTVNSTRATGTTAENAANIYESVATNTVDATVALREHGVLSQAATGGGVLLDRTLFSAINLVSGDSLASTYRLTLTAGS